MKERNVLKFVSLFVLIGLLSGGFTGTPVSGNEPDGQPITAGKNKDANVLTGRIDGVSKKAKSIALVVGSGDKEQQMMVKFDDSTLGMEHALKGEAAIIHFEERGREKYATVVKPKLAVLPEGVREMQPEDLIKLVELGPEKGGYFLVDSRPAKGFAAGHIPTAVSIPVEMMATKAAEMLPMAKDSALIFYCGGPT